jgi:nucleotide-binding universal stress UspA family protein
MKAVRPGLAAAPARLTLLCHELQRSIEVDVQRVIVGVTGSAGSLEALRHAAELARTNKATLMPVLAWTPPGGEMADRRYPSAQLRAAWKQAAMDRLAQAIELAIGGQPAEVEFCPRIVQGAAGEALTRIAREPGDVLVIGSGRHGALRLLSSHVARYCVSHGACPVVAVPPSELGSRGHGLRSWADRRRAHPQAPSVSAAA